MEMAHFVILVLTNTTMVAAVELLQFVQEPSPLQKQTVIRIVDLELEGVH